MERPPTREKTPTVAASTCGLVRSFPPTEVSDADDISKCWFGWPHEDDSTCRKVTTEEVCFPQGDTTDCGISFPRQSACDIFDCAPDKPRIDAMYPWGIRSLTTESCHPPPAMVDLSAIHEASLLARREECDENLLPSTPPPVLLEDSGTRVTRSKRRHFRHIVDLALAREAAFGGKTGGDRRCHQILGTAHRVHQLSPVDGRVLPDPTNAPHFNPRGGQGSEHNEPGAMVYPPSPTDSSLAPGEEVGRRRKMRTEEDFVPREDHNYKAHQSESLRRCRNCGTDRTPQWRGGPDGPRSLCNACGVRLKKGIPLEKYPGYECETKWLGFPQGRFKRKP